MNPIILNIPSHMVYVIIYSVILVLLGILAFVLDFYGIRESFARFIYPSIFESERRTRENYRKLHHEHSENKEQLKYYREYFDDLKAIIEKGDYERCQVALGKDGKPVLLKICGYHDRLDFNIRAVTPLSKQGSHDMLAMFKISKWEFYDMDNRMTIHDINGWGIENGYGSLIMEEILRIAREQKVKRITGSIGHIDYDDHKERLLHFYKKFGFRVEVDENIQVSIMGKVTLDLDPVPETT